FIFFTFFCVFFFFFFFFFSSRRRHTRWPRDWSSDVCSSDLLLANVHLDPATPEQIAHGKRLVTDYGCASCHEIGGIKKPENFARSEERRVGKESRSQRVRKH